MSFQFDLDTIDRRRLVPGLILIALGVLGLLGSLGWLGGLGGLIGTALFGAAAYYAYQQGQRTGAIGWRASVYPLAGLAIAGVAPEPISGAAFLAGLGIAFVLAYRDDPARWWAIIPAGALLAMALTSLVEDGARRSGGGGSVFLLGLAATFFVLSRLPDRPQRWAVYPAAALAALALLALTTGGGWVVPVVFIALGAWMLMKPETAREVREQVARTVRGAMTPRPAPTSEPAPSTESSAPAPSTPAPSTEPKPEPRTTATTAPTGAHPTADVQPADPGASSRDDGSAQS